ncbi:MAG TPA: helix-turn-helix domain-containing protein [Bryobacteraceae bacterium]|nr:helix-turn-helix domain-containing protein [Bryobacteraceae bacterium]
MRKADLGGHMRRFGEVLVRVREGKGVSREALCRICGMPAGTLEQVERGVSPRRGFGLTELCRVASALGVSPGTLLESYEEAVAPSDVWWTGDGNGPERKKP